MLIAHEGISPKIHSTAWVAPDATVCGDVRIGPGARVLHGARLVGEAGGRISIGAETIVMENAVVRATARHNCAIDHNCLIGPNAHVAGAHVEPEVFIATGAAVFHGSRLGRGSEVRVHAIVQLRTRLEPGATVPMGWVAIGDPARLLPPDRHDEIWSIQAPLNFPDWVYGLARETPQLMVMITRTLSASLGAHAKDRPD
jgi:carbonic anhydrase/acetyltransferase-like protein (isoleucine patch superfamily)